MIKSVIKRDGTVEYFNADKINSMATWAVEAAPSVPWSDIVMDAVRLLSKEIVTAQEIQDALIKVCIDREDYQHNKIAGRLVLGSIRKSSFAADTFKEHYQIMVEDGYYRDMDYTSEDLSVLSEVVAANKDVDLSYGYPTLRQFIDKYAIRSEEGNLLELPQYMYMAVAMSMFEHGSIEDVILYYNKASAQKINIPSPVLSQQRTSSNTGVSCVISTAGDSLGGIEATKHVAFMSTASSAGLGIEYDVRSPKDSVRRGYAKAGGKLPHYRVLDKITDEVKQCYDEKTEILTTTGFKFFQELTSTCLVAQVDNKGFTNFVKPLNIFSYKYKGDMYSFKDKGNNRKVVDLLVTGNHRMSHRYNKHVKYMEATNEGEYFKIENSYRIEKSFRHTLAEDFEPKRNTVFERGSLSQGELKILSPNDRLRIAFQADGHRHSGSNKSLYFHFSKQRKIDRLIKLADYSGYSYSKCPVGADGSTAITVQVGKVDGYFDKEFSWVDLSKISSVWGLEFLKEVSCWDASPQDSKSESYTYCNTNEVAIDKVMAVCVLSGVTCSKSSSEGVKENHLTFYRLGMSFGRRFVSGRGCKKEIVPYEGLVSCVEVPTGNIIVRRNGMAVVCGNSNRGGSATVSFNVLDPEIETLLNLKLKRSPETKRIDQLDYSLVWNNEFLKSAATRQDWKLYSKKVCPEAHTAFYNGEATQHLDNETSKLNALDILKQYSNNRLETGRLYWTNIDNVNEHTPWKDNIRLSNLCQEVLLPTKEYNSVFDLAKHTYEDGDGITAQCFLSAIDLARITDDTDYEETAYIVLKSLDNLIETMNYPLPQMGATAKHFRSVGVGLTNLAYHLAKEGRKFNDVNYLHYLAERHYYFLMKASIKLSKERGKFGYYDKTKWADGWTPLETYKKNVDTLVTNDRLRYDWASLQGESLRSGVRFSTLTAHMPCESSSVMGNGTNGLYPIRHKVVYKDSKSGLVQFFAPDVDTLEYENAYDVGPYTLINSYSIFQKFNDQGISADTYEDLSKGNGKVSTTELIKKILYANKMGMKTWYYNNTKTGRGEDKTVLVDDGCSSCKL